MKVIREYVEGKVQWTERKRAREKKYIYERVKKKRKKEGFERKGDKKNMLKRE